MLSFSLNIWLKLYFFSRNSSCDFKRLILLGQMHLEGFKTHLNLLLMSCNCCSLNETLVQVAFRKKHNTPNLISPLPYSDKLRYTLVPANS